MGIYSPVNKWDIFSKPGNVCVKYLLVFFGSPDGLFLESVG